MKPLWKLLASLVLAMGLAGCNEGDSSPAAPTASPVATPPVVAPVARTDLFYCYYGTWDGQTQAVKDHTNCGWAGPQWGSTQGITEGTWQIATNRLAELRAAGNRCVILDVLMAFDGNEADAEKVVRAYFDYLQTKGVIGDYICALYPADEPDARGFSAELIVARNALVRRVAKDYPFIANIPVFTIYTCHSDFPGVESVDWASVDDYDSKAGVITKCIEPLRKRLRPEQRLWLTPGGFQCDDIQPFYDYAQKTPQVLGIDTFIWHDGWDGSTNARGLESQPCRASYLNVGRLIKGG